MYLWGMFGREEFLTSVRAQPVAAIPLVTQGIAQGGRLPTEA